MSTNNLEKPAAEFVAMFSQAPPLNQMTAADARKLVADAPAAPIPMPDVDESWITVPVDVGDVRIRIVKPPHSAEPLPVVQYMHGGGWVIGGAPGHERLVRELAVGANAAVVSVDYSLAPEARYPVQVEQCYAVARWITEQGASHGLDPTRLAVAGDSAGGNMATVLALMAKQRDDVHFIHQSLYYPITDAGEDTESYRLFKDGPYGSSDMMAWFWANYLPDQELRSEITVSPLRATREDLQGLPPALIIVDENDVLRDQGEAYAAKLRDAGVPTASLRFNGTIHDFLTLDPLSGTESTRAGISQAVSTLQRAFRGESA